MSKKRGNRRGFSLLELLMVAAVILIIAGLAIPNFIRSRYSANEASASSTLRLIYNAQNQYAGTYNSFSNDLNTLGPVANGAAPDANTADLVDPLLAGRIGGTTTQFSKSGYKFTYFAVGSYPNVQQYHVTADPLLRGNTGQRSFYMDQSGIIRANGGAAATSNDLPID